MSITLSDQEERMISRSTADSVPVSCTRAQLQHDRCGCAPLLQEPCNPECFHSAGLEPACSMPLRCQCTGGRREAATYDEGDAEDKELRDQTLEEVQHAAVLGLSFWPVDCLHLDDQYDSASPAGSASSASGWPFSRQASHIQPE